MQKVQELDHTSVLPSSLGVDRAKPTKALLSAGGVLGALAASSCCILPVALFSLGATGAWIGSLGSLAIYQPIFLAVTAAFLGGGFYLVYRKPKAAECAPGEACAKPISNRVTKSVLWAATGLAIAAFAFPYAWSAFA